MTKCKGCGIRLQNLDPEKVGYTPKLENDLCMRCFKLKNYNILTNEGVVIDNKEILSKINKKKSYVLFIVDFLNLDKEVIDTYKSITNSKTLVLTKCDIIPKNIKNIKIPIFHVSLKLPIIVSNITLTVSII